MFARIAVPVVVGISLAAGATLAAGRGGRDEGHARMEQYAAVTSASLAEKCTSLGQQAATAIKEHASAKKIADARKMQDEGTKLCAASNTMADGIMKYEKALRDLGVKPQY